MARIDEVCARVARPEQFTDHPHCEECAEANEFFATHTPASLGAFRAPPETLPLAFLTPHAMRYFLPALLRMLVFDPRATDVLNLIENRLDILNNDEAAALRDVLYTIYDRSSRELHSGFFTFEALCRVVDRLDERLG